MHLSHLLAKSWNAGLEPVNYLVTNVVQSSTIYSPNFLQDTILSSAQHSLLRKPFLVLQDTSHEIFFHWHFQFGFSQGTQKCKGVSKEGIATIREVACHFWRHKRLHVLVFILLLVTLLIQTLNNKSVRMKPLVVLMVVLQTVSKVNQLIKEALGQLNVKRESFLGALASELNTFSEHSRRKVELKS